jgi:hypothetical protein
MARDITNALNTEFNTDSINPFFADGNGCRFNIMALKIG